MGQPKIKMEIMHELHKVQFQQQRVVDLLKFSISEHYMYHDPNWYVCVWREFIKNACGINVFFKFLVYTCSAECLIKNYVSLVPRPSLTAFFAAVREGLGTRLELCH